MKVRMRALRQILNALDRRVGFVLLCLAALYFPVAHGYLAPGLQAQTAQDPLKQHYDAARDSLRNGDQDRAAVEYKAFLGEAIHRVANARARAGDLDEAGRTFEEVLLFTGLDAATRLDYASVLFDGSHLQEAKAMAQSVVNAQPDNAKAHMLLGRIYFEQKDYPSAKEQFVAAGTGSLSEDWRSLTMTYLRLQDLASARILLQKVIAVLGDTSETHVAIATAYYYGDYPDQAIIELKKVLAQSTATPGAHYYLGLAYLSRTEETGYPKAIPEFRAELKLYPNDFPSHYMLGYIFAKQRSFGDAQPELDHAASLNPADGGTQLLLGELYVETRRLPEAEAALRKLIVSSGGNSPDHITIRAHYMLGRLLQEEGKLEEGTDEIRKSEQLRKQMRLTTAEVSGSRISRPAVAGSKEMDNSSGHHRSAPASTQEQAQAQAFIAKLSPAIAEGYYNLAGIASQRHDPVTAAQYLCRASIWDPSLATGGQR